MGILQWRHSPFRVVFSVFSLQSSFFLYFSSSTMDAWSFWKKCYFLCGNGGCHQIWKFVSFAVRINLKFHIKCEKALEDTKELIQADQLCLSSRYRIWQLLAHLETSKCNRNRLGFPWIPIEICENSFKLKKIKDFAIVEIISVTKLGRSGAGKRENMKTRMSGDVFPAARCVNILITCRRHEARR